MMAFNEIALLSIRGHRGIIATTSFVRAAAATATAAAAAHRQQLA